MDHIVPLSAAHVYANRLAPQKGNTLQYPVNDQSMSMTSLEIADLVEKRHDNVKRTIETLIEKSVIASPQVEEKPTAGRPMLIYVFEGEQGKRDSIVVVAQLSPEFTAKQIHTVANCPNPKNQHSTWLITYRRKYAGHY